MANSKKDFCDHICPFFCYVIIFFVSYAVYSVHTIRNTGPYYLLYFFILIDILSIWSHLRSWTANPGYLPINYKELNVDKLPSNTRLYFQQELERGENTKIYFHDMSALSYPNVNLDKNNSKSQIKLAKQITKVCYTCNSIKPPMAHHCNECQR